MQLDLASGLNLEPSILPQAATGDVTGSAIDTKEANSACVFGFMDTAAGGTFKVQEATASGGTYTDVPDAQCIQGDDTRENEKAGVAGDLVKIGVINTKRYLRLVFTHSADGDVSGGIILGNNLVTPTETN